MSLLQDGSAVTDDIDLFVYSEAIPQDAQERKRAEALHIPQKSYPQALGELLKDYKVIAVCGTHGKSSTTAMAGRLLLEAGLDPTIIVGTKMKELNGRNWRLGNSDLFVVEACEYRKSFHSYKPDITLFTNCDGDHFDFYPTLKEYHAAFLEFFRCMPENGAVITHGKDLACRSLAEQSEKEIIDADTFPLIPLQTPGVHMQQNAALVLALADVLGIPQAKAIKSLSGYAGSWRRQEIKGEEDGVLVIDDYAHHPVEIRATIDAIKSAYPKRRLVVVFQPHTHHRTRSLYKDFIGSFVKADLLVIPDIYVARADIEMEKVDIDAFVMDAGKASGIPSINGKSIAATETLLRSDILQSGDVLLCMGAGSIASLPDRMLEMLKTRR